MPRLILSLATQVKTPRKGCFLFSLPFTVVGFLALVLGWLLPNHYPPWTSFHSEAAVFLALMALCLAALIEKKTLPFDGISVALLSLIALVWLQYACGLILYAGDALVSSLYLGGGALACWLGNNSARSENDAKAAVSLFSTLVVTGAVISVFIAVLQWLFMEERLGVFAATRGPMRPFGNLGQPNHLSTLILMAVVLSSVLYVQARLRRWQWLALAVYLSFGLVLTESRTGLLGALLVGLFFVFYSRRIKGVGGWKAIAAWWALLAVFVSLLAPLNEALYLQVPRELDLAQDSPRMTMWKQMLQAIGQAPWFGYGWRQTVVAQKAGANAFEGTLPTEYAHNVALDLLAWLGIPLGLMLLGLILFWFVITARKVKTPEQLFLFLAVLPFCLHSLLEFPFAYAYFLFPVAWMLGALNARQNAPAAIQEGGRRWPALLGVTACLAVFSGLCAQAAWEYLQVEDDYRVMRFEFRKVGRTPADYTAPRLTLLTQLDEMLKVGRMQPYPGMPPADIERMRVANVSFAWATLQLNYVVALGLNGRPEEATRELMNLRAVYGAASYLQAKSAFIRLRDERYPQLSSVKLP